MAQCGDHDAAVAELQRAYNLAEQVKSPTLFYPIANELRQEYKTVGREQEAMSCDNQAKAAIEQIGHALEAQTLRDIFLNSASVQAVLTFSG